MINTHVSLTVSYVNKHTQFPILSTRRVLNSDCCLPLLFSTKPQKQWSSHERSTAYFPVSLTVLTLVLELLLKTTRICKNYQWLFCSLQCPPELLCTFEHNQVIFKSTCSLLVILFPFWWFPTCMYSHCNCDCQKVFQVYSLNFLGNKLTAVPSPLKGFLLRSSLKEKVTILKIWSFLHVPFSDDTFYDSYAVELDPTDWTGNIIVNENLAFNDKYQMLTSVGWSHYTYYSVMPDPVRLHLWNTQSH